jgi:hypothetical protein
MRRLTAVATLRRKGLQIDQQRREEGKKGRRKGEPKEGRKEGEREGKVYEVGGGGGEGGRTNKGRTQKEGGNER